MVLQRSKNNATANTLGAWNCEYLTSICTLIMKKHLIELIFSSPFKLLWWNNLSEFLHKLLHYVDLGFVQWCHSYVSLCILVAGCLVANFLHKHKHLVFLFLPFIGKINSKILITLKVLCRDLTCDLVCFFTSWQLYSVIISS